MTRPETPYEAVSYDLKQFRERRMAERRATQRDTVDRRQGWLAGRMQPQEKDALSTDDATKETN